MQAPNRASASSIRSHRRTAAPSMRLCALLGVLSAACYTGARGGNGGADDGAEDTGDGPNDGDADGTAGEPSTPGGDIPDFMGPGVCRGTVNAFRDEVWHRFMAADCHGCHNPSGLAGQSPFVLHGPGYPHYITENLQTLRVVAGVVEGEEFQGTPLPLLKMTGAVPHGGGPRFEEGSQEYEALAAVLKEFEKPIDCIGPEDYDVLFSRVEELDALHTLRRATFALVGHRPTTAQEQAVADGDWGALDAVLDEIMDEPAFASRVAQIYNDALLTDSFLRRGNTILHAMNQELYPWAWFDETDNPGPNRLRTIEGLTREPLELIKYIVREKRPFSEILLADYLMVNSYNARAYGLGIDQFEDPENVEEYHPVQLDGVAHAGILTTEAFLLQYPTTESNLNRHRALHVYRLFQGSNVFDLSFGALPAELEDENPTMTAPACAVCHSYIDPIASSFQHWDALGRQRPDAEWPDAQTMRPAGFNGKPRPDEEAGASLPWLARQLVDNPRFAVSVVKVIFSGLLRQEPLAEPRDPLSPTYYEDIIGFAAQDVHLKDIAEHFRDDDYDIRTLIKELVRSPYFRAIGATDLNEEEQQILADVGVAHTLTPTQLYARIEESTGLRWRPDAGGSVTTLPTLELMFGEIDSLTVTTRIDEANGLLSNYITRMADQVACGLVPVEYAMPPGDRKMLPKITFAQTEASAAGEAAIRDNIRYLHDHLFSAWPAVNDEEVDTLFDLFVAARADGAARVASGETSASMPSYCRRSSFFDGSPIPEEDRLTEDPDYIARAWIAVVSTLLADYRFIHE